MNRVLVRAPRRGVALTELGDWLLVIVPGVIWGASFLFIAEALGGFAADGVTFLRILIGLGSLSLVPSARQPILTADRWHAVSLGVLWQAFPMSMFPLAEPGDNRTGRVGGVLMILAALVSYGVAINIAGPLQQRNGALPVIWRAQIAAAVLTAPLGLPAALDGRWSTRPVLALLALGALGTCVVNVVSAIAAGRLGPTRASTSAFLIPVVALILGVTVRHEVVSPTSITGAVVCLGGCLVRRAGAHTHPIGQPPAVPADVDFCGRALVQESHHCAP